MYLNHTHDEAKDFAVVNEDTGYYLRGVLWVNEETQAARIEVRGGSAVARGNFRIVARDGSDRRPSH